MDNKSLDSTTYDVKALTNYDRRFEAGKRDAIFSTCLAELLLSSPWYWPSCSAPVTPAK